MKNRLSTTSRPGSLAFLAAFGGAELHEVAGEIYLDGGNDNERAEALEWMSLCLPERFARLRKPVVLSQGHASIRI